MFGLSWGQIGIIVLVGAFVLGPERIPTAVRFLSDNLRRARTMVAGVQSSLHNEFGTELAELRIQVAELQGLKELVELRSLRDLHPQRLLGAAISGTGGPDGAAGRSADAAAPFRPPAPGPIGPVDLSKSLAFQPPGDPA